ncbi:MAG: FecR domain-containing protein [Archangium sp.]|nr:FecR domain-containing protein [Archangium sp.]
MTPPTRLSDGAQTPAEHQIALAASVEASPLRADGWDDLMARAVLARPPVARLIPAFVLSFMCGVGLVVALRPVQPPPSPGTVVLATAASRWSSPAPNEVTLQSGRLWMTTPSDEPLLIRTPDVVLEVTRSRFLAEVVSGGTTIQVDEGQVVLRANEVVRVVRSGESLTWPPAPVIPGPLLELAPASESRCSSLDATASRACLRSEADGNSLAAQAALYELGVAEVKRGALEEGLQVWRESLERFPGGVLHPEVRLALLIELVKARRFSEAREAATDFELQCAADPRLLAVASLRRALPPGRP